MTEEGDARTWLRANGYSDIADTIDRIVRGWRERGVQTRRNWWDILAGTASGEPRKVEGTLFPILAAARRRKGWPVVEGEIGPREQLAPDPVPQARWTSHPSKQERKAVVARKSGAPKSRTKRSAQGRTRSERALDFVITKFAHLDEVVIPLRDLVVLVGPQGTGKSIALELLKLVIDRHRIVRFLKQHGVVWETDAQFAGLYFGGGFEASWHRDTRVQLGGESFSLMDLARARARKGEDAVFYIPAHRTLAIADGWPRAFSTYPVETPYVARRFSEGLLTAINQGLIGKGKIFPHDRRLKDAFRQLIDEAVFHGGTLKLDTIGMRKQFVLEYGSTERKSRFPYMAWTAGQREFTPLLLGLYHLLPAGGGPKKREIEWVIIEEPEMGLHPKATVAVMAVVLDLLARGYKVALSTHSPTVLEVVWGMSKLKTAKDGPARLCRMMGLPDRHPPVLRSAGAALERTHAVVHLQHDANGRVSSKNISALNPGSADEREWQWGGLIGFSDRVEKAVTGTDRRT